MEEDLSGASFSEINLSAPQSEFGKYLDMICPYYLMYGMTWNEFWFESIERFGSFWQKNQFEIERRNQELWLQGLYIQEAVASVLDSKHRVKYPSKPFRLTEMTEIEKEAERKRMVAEMREALNSHKRRWDAKHKGVDAVGNR